MAHVYQLRLSEAEWKRVKTEAARHELTVAAFIRKALGFERAEA